MHRREAFRLLGAIAAVPFLPDSADAATSIARRIHESIQGGARFRTFSPSQQALVSRLADAVIPRTDTPGALDVRVPEFIDHMMTDWASAAERQALLDGLAVIGARAGAAGNAVFAALPVTRQAAILTQLDSELTATSGAGYAWAQVKSLTVVGYFTAEPVQRDVLRTQVIHAAFDGCSPL